MFKCVKTHDLQFFFFKKHELFTKLIFPADGLISCLMFWSLTLINSYMFDDCIECIDCTCIYRLWNKTPIIPSGLIFSSGNIGRRLSLKQTVIALLKLSRDLIPFSARICNMMQLPSLVYISKFQKYCCGSQIVSDLNLSFVVNIIMNLYV